MPVYSELSDRTRRFFDSDIWYSFTRSKVTMTAAVVTALLMAADLEDQLGL